MTPLVKSISSPRGRVTHRANGDRSARENSIILQLWMHKTAAEIARILNTTEGYIRTKWRRIPASMKVVYVEGRGLVRMCKYSSDVYKRPTKHGRKKKTTPVDHSKSEYRRDLQRVRPSKSFAYSAGMRVPPKRPYSHG